jgi:prevent-host-death family protein
MATVIPQKLLRNDIGAVLRRVEAGETMTVTVAGRPVAQLQPAPRRQWVSGPALREVWAGAAPRDLEQDLAAFPGELADPFA